jgi:hypothetical protein
VLNLVRDTALARSRLAEIINSWTAMELDVMTSIWRESAAGGPIRLSAVI